MQVHFDHVSPTRYIIMSNGSRWDPAPGEGDTVMAWEKMANIAIRGPLSGVGYNYQLTNMDTGESIMARKDD
jgi:hypothetical protein